MEKPKGHDAGILSHPITRRQAIKAGGITVVGLAFSKPLVESIYPKSAFAQYVAGKPSIEWFEPNPQIDDLDLVDAGGGGDLELLATAVQGSYVVRAKLCNVSDDTPVTIDAWKFRRELVPGKGPVDPVTIKGVVLNNNLQTVGGLPELTAPPINGVVNCMDVHVTVTTGTDSGERKVKIWVQGIDTFGQETSERLLTITITIP